MADELQFHQAELDLSKLCMSGHSMGALTALRVGRTNKRVKCVMTHDPWLGALYKEVELGTFTGYTPD
jgi:surfactin synthase thioesterase subunit